MFLVSGSHCHNSGYLGTRSMGAVNMGYWGNSHSTFIKINNYSECCGRGYGHGYDYGYGYGAEKYMAKGFAWGAILTGAALLLNSPIGRAIGKGIGTVCKTAWKGISWIGKGIGKAASWVGKGVKNLWNNIFHKKDKTTKSTETPVTPATQQKTEIKGTVPLEEASPTTIEGSVELGLLDPSLKKNNEYNLFNADYESQV